MGLKTMQESGTRRQSCNKEKELSFPKSHSSLYPKWDFLSYLWVGTQSGTQSGFDILKTHTQNWCGKVRGQPTPDLRSFSDVFWASRQHQQMYSSVQDN